MRRSEIGIAFQDFNLFPTWSAIENIEIATFGTGIRSRERKRRSEATLDAVRTNRALKALAPRALRRRAPARRHRA